MGKILVTVIIDLQVCVVEEKATYNKQSKEVKIEWMDLKEYGRKRTTTKSAHMSQLDEPK